MFTLADPCIGPARMPQLSMTRTEQLAQVYLVGNRVGQHPELDNRWSLSQGVDRRTSWPPKLETQLTWAPEVVDNTCPLAS
mgnify:CR=1 FL=1